MEGLDSNVVTAILVTGVGGLGVTALTELLKRFLQNVFKLEGSKAIGYVCSAIVSLVATAVMLFTSGGFTVTAMVGYSLAVFLTANGIFKFSAKAARGE